MLLLFKLIVLVLNKIFKTVKRLIFQKLKRPSFLKFFFLKKKTCTEQNTWQNNFQPMIIVSKWSFSILQNHILIIGESNEQKKDQPWKTQHVVRHAVYQKPYQITYAYKVYIQPCTIMDESGSLWRNTYMHIKLYNYIVSCISHI